MGLPAAQGTAEAAQPLSSTCTGLSWCLAPLSPLDHTRSSRTRGVPGAARLAGPVCGAPVAHGQVDLAAQQLKLVATRHLQVQRTQRAGGGRCCSGRWGRACALRLGLRCGTHHPCACACTSDTRNTRARAFCSMLLNQVSLRTKCTSGSQAVSQSPCFSYAVANSASSGRPSEAQLGGGGDPAAAAAAAALVQPPTAQPQSTKPASLPAALAVRFTHDMLVNASCGGVHEVAMNAMTPQCRQ